MNMGPNAVEAMKKMAFHENLRMHRSMYAIEGGGTPNSNHHVPPFKLMDALKYLNRKKSLTANDLSNHMSCGYRTARALLDRLEVLGFASSEMISEERIRIYDLRIPPTVHF